MGNQGDQNPNIAKNSNNFNNPKNNNNQFTGENNNQRDDQGWHRVHYRNAEYKKKIEKNDEGGQGSNTNSKKDSRIKLNLLERMSMSFYITNFPTKITAKDIWNRCREFGTIVDVFIPNRLSKAGRRFGFIKFTKVDNAARLLRDLNSIWFGNYLVFVDMVKYSRNTGLREITVSEQNNVKPHVEALTKAQSSSDPLVKKPLSYADALSGVEGIEASSGYVHKGNTPISFSGPRCIKLPGGSSDLLDNVKTSVLAKISDPECIPKVGLWLYEEGFAHFKASYVGGRWLFLSFESMEAKDLFLANATLRSRFCAFKTPCSSFVPDERMVWVNISGLPLGAWKQDSIQAVMDNWGQCKFFANDWVDSFSMCKVCVLVHSKKFIFEELKVSLDEKPYDIWIKEFALWEPKIRISSQEVSNSEVSSQSDDSDDNCSFDDDIIASEQFDDNLCCDKSEVEVECGIQDHGGSNCCENMNDKVNLSTKEVNHDPIIPDVSLGRDMPDVEGSLVKQDRKGCENLNVDINSNLQECNHAPKAQEILDKTIAKEETARNSENISGGLDNNFGVNEDEFKDRGAVDNDAVNQEVNHEASSGYVHKGSNRSLSEVDKQKDGTPDGFQDDVAPVVGDKINSSERLAHHNNGLDDYDVFLINRLLHQDKCRVRPTKAAANSNLKLTEEFSSTWLDYVGPLLSDELDPEICWNYKDPSGNVQGPFSLVQLHTWKDYFSSDFEIWRYYGSVRETVLLHSVLKRRTKDVG